jgi:hypothetical protein
LAARSNTHWALVGGGEREGAARGKALTGAMSLQKGEKVSNWGVNGEGGEERGCKEDSLVSENGVRRRSTTDDETFSFRGEVDHTHVFVPEVEVFGNALCTRRKGWSARTRK